jgi:hypothetical protein
MPALRYDTSSNSTIAPSSASAAAVRGQEVVTVRHPVQELPERTSGAPLAIFILRLRKETV